MLQALESVTVSCTGPADKPPVELRILPSDQRYVYGAVPPLTALPAVPSFPPKQVTVAGMIEAVKAAGSEMMIVSLIGQAFVSVTVQMYVPAQRPLTEAVVADPGIQR